jgi:hypothetical protein
MTGVLRLSVDQQCPEAPGFMRPVLVNLMENVGWLLALPDLAPLSPKCEEDPLTPLGELPRDRSQCPALCITVLRLPMWPAGRLALPMVHRHARHFTPVA